MSRLEELQEQLKAELCRFFPHDWQEHESTRPDHLTTFVVCTRCGETGWLL